ncbi:MAG: lysoplasmalogenase [Acidobacteria bacterium]|nr:lysoplasmalogenase [Acidobacteriota bacterium]
MAAVVLSVILVAVLVAGEKSGRMALRAPAKIAASAVFVAVGVARYSSGHPYDAWLVLGLVLGAIGDVLLLLPRGFLAGLVVFLLGHAAYIVAFHTLAPIHSWPLGFLAPVVIVSGVASNLLWAHLGKLRWAVLGYVTVISIMVWGAAGTVAAGDRAGWMRLAGAVCFYASDLLVARNRFVKKTFNNRAWGLPLYYAGQLILAFTVGRMSR